MIHQAAEHEPPAITRLRCRLLAPMVRAGKMTASFVAVHREASQALRARLARLAEVSSKPQDASEMSPAAGHVTTARETQPLASRRDCEDESGASAAAAPGERPTRPTDEIASSPQTADDPSQTVAADFPPAEARMSGTGGQRTAVSEKLSREELAAIERAAHYATEDILRPMRHRQRALAEEVRACLVQAPAFQ